MSIRTTLRDERGLTLVELIIASTIFAIIAIASAILFSTVLKLSSTSKLVEEIQREGDAVVAGFARNMRDTVSVDTSLSNFVTNPNTLALKTSGGQTRRYYVLDGQLHYVDESGTDQSLLQPGTTVTNLVFATSSDSSGLQVVTVNLKLARTKAGQTQQLDFGSTINTRPQ
jgi:prepilin-type N-terminal cleavage/methylation domain-containing protein